MDALIETGQTKVQGDTTLVSKSLTSELGEQVFVLLQVEGEGSSARGFQKECLDIVKTALLETDGEATQRLDSTLKELNGLVKGLLLSKTISDMHAIIAVVDQKTTLHVSHAGRAEAYVVRSGTASQITEYTRGKSSPAFIHIASGQLEPRDAIILSTQRLLRTVTPAQLAQMCTKPESVLSELKGSLEAEREEAAFAMLKIDAEKDKSARNVPPIRSRVRRKKGNVLIPLIEVLSVGIQKGISMLPKNGKEKISRGWIEKIKSFVITFKKDLRDPTRKKKAHLILVAGIIAVFLIVWVGTNLISFSQNSQSKAELKQLVEEINNDIQTAENRRLTGDIESANAILKRAEERTKELMDNERGLFRKEAMEIFGRIQSTKEEINNLIRLSPRTVANLTVRKPSIKALGFIGLEEEEFIVYDRQDLYRVIHNNIDDPDRLSDEELILNGVNFPRYQTNVFQMTGNGITEIIAGQPTSMKTDDAAGWITGTDMEAYLRYLYILSPENNQIYKYERLSNRYSEPVEYNVNGDLEGALDMAIDGNIYIIKEEGEVVKLLRGEQQPFVMRNTPDDDVLSSATKVFKVLDGNLYFLDPVRSRVIVATDGGSSGEAVYVKQYVLEGDEIGELKDLYVDPDESRLYILDEKRLYKVDLTTM